MALPSHREPCALVYIEAALLAKPIVACKSGGTPEIVAHGETGLLTPPFQAPAIATAINTLLDNPRQAAHMGRRGKDRALVDFTWPRFFRQLEKAYERVAA